MDGVRILILVLVLASAFGLWRRRTDGRMRAVSPASAPVPPRDCAAQPGGDAMAVVAGDARTDPTDPGRDDSEPLVVDGRPVEVADHSLVPPAGRLGPDDLGGAALGERATLVQFSSAFCTPCRATRVVLADVAGMVTGVTHVEIDAESHLDLVRSLDVTRTPTVLVLDYSGLIRTRATGAPRRADVIAAIGQLT